MFEELELLTHSSIKISGKRVIYFDPFEVKDEGHDADLIFITHEHHDHFCRKTLKSSKRRYMDHHAGGHEGVRGKDRKP